MSETRKLLDALCLSEMSISDLTTLMICCSASRDESDLNFAKQCREEIKRRKPLPTLPEKTK